MTFTRQEPYVGEKYEDSTLFGVRVMVVGASHYCGEFDRQTMCTLQCKSFGKYRNSCGQYFGERCELFTINVMRRYLGKDASFRDCGWKRTYTKFLKSLFKNHDASLSDCRKLVEHLIFTEYLQGAEGRDASDKNDALFTKDPHYEALKENIEKYRPDVVIFWGNRVWAQIVKRREEAQRSSTRCEVMIDGHKVQFVKISHPSRRGYYKTEPHRQFEEVGVRLIDRKEPY